MYLVPNDIRFPHHQLFLRREEVWLRESRAEDTAGQAHYRSLLADINDRESYHLGDRLVRPTTHTYENTVSRFRLVLGPPLLSVCALRFWSYELSDRLGCNAPRAGGLVQHPPKRLRPRAQGKLVLVSIHGTFLRSHVSLHSGSKSSASRT